MVGSLLYYMRMKNVIHSTYIHTHVTYTANGVQFIFRFFIANSVQHTQTHMYGSVHRRTYTHRIERKCSQYFLGVCAISYVLENFVCSIKQRASCVEEKNIVVIYFVVFDHYIARAAHTTYLIQTEQRRIEERIKKRNETTNREC